MRHALLMIVFVASASTLEAQARPSTQCASFQRVIDESEKEIAAIYAEGVADNSAPRATLREQRTTNELQLIRLNLDLMIQHRCPVSSVPVTRSAYLLNALTCETERLRNPSETSPAACDRATWQRVDADSAASTNPRP
jgi:hypothetical protein